MIRHAKVIPGSLFVTRRYAFPELYLIVNEELGIHVEPDDACIDDASASDHAGSCIRVVAAEMNGWKRIA